jgi:hypothetical protein
MKVAEMFAYLGVVSDEKKVKDFFNLLDAGKGILFGVATAAVGTSLGIGAMMDRAILGALALAHFSAETGLSAQTLQAWQHVGESMGLTADEVTGSIVGLNKQLAMVRLGQGNIAPFQMLGINVGQDAYGVMRQLRGIVQSGRYNPQTLSAIMEQMGLSASLVKVLKLTNAEFDRMSNRNAILSEVEIDRAVKFNASLKEMGQNIIYLFSIAFADLAPTMTELLRNLKEWEELNRGKLKAGIIEVTTAVGGMAREVTGAFSLVDRAIQSSIGWENAVKGLALAFLAFHPVLAILIAVIDALNTINTFMTNGKGFMDNWKDFTTGKMGPLSWMSGWGNLLTSGAIDMGKSMGKGALGFDLGSMYLRPLTSPAISPSITNIISATGDPKEIGEQVEAASLRAINRASAQIPMGW